MVSLNIECSGKNRMDTTFLTREAYRVLSGESGDISAFLRADVGAAAHQYPDEESYLRGMRDFAASRAADPLDYLVGWNLDGEVAPDQFGPRIAEFETKIIEVLRRPIGERGPVDA